MHVLPNILISCRNPTCAATSEYIMLSYLQGIFSYLRSNSLNETLRIKVKIRSSFWSVLSPIMGKSGPEKSVFGHFSRSENNRNDKVYVLFVKLFWQKQLSWKNSWFCEKYRPPSLAWLVNYLNLINYIYFYFLTLG